ncbi:MAG: hypothetical protein AAF945_08645 [Actinomycetota bacterium]
MTWIVLVVGVLVILAVDQILRRRRRARPEAVASAPARPRGANPGETVGFPNHKGGG